MREPFTELIGRGERLLAAREVDLATRTGPLAMPAELLALFSPLLSIVLVVRLHGAEAKLLGAVLPPLILIALARLPLRRWRRPRQWLGVTDRRILIWRRPAAIRSNPRIDQLPLEGVVGVELEQDDWDRRVGSHQVVLHYAASNRALGRVRDAAVLRDAIVQSVTSAAVAVAPAPPVTLPGDFVPHAKQG